MMIHNNIKATYVLDFVSLDSDDSDDTTSSEESSDEEETRKNYSLRRQRRPPDRFEATIEGKARKELF